MNKNFDQVLTFIAQNNGEVFSSPRMLFGKGEEEHFTVFCSEDENEEILIKKEDGSEILLNNGIVKEAVYLLEEKNIVSIIPENLTNAPVSMEEYLSVWHLGTKKSDLDKKTVPYIADLIVLSGVAAYGWANNSKGEKFAAVAMKNKNTGEKSDTSKETPGKTDMAGDSSEKKRIQKDATENTTGKRPSGPVLITYSTRHGSTTDIAWSVKNAFQDEGIDSEIKRIQDVEDVRRYKMVIIGTPIYNNKLLPEVVEFARLHKNGLSKRMTALFVTGISLRDKDDEIIIKTMKVTDQIGRYVDLADVGMFAGKLLPENLPIKERISAALNKEKTGDFRDWREIGEWADKIKKMYLQI